MKCEYCNHAIWRYEEFIDLSMGGKGRLEVCGCDKDLEEDDCDENEE